jgi:hypothetical protein
MEDSGKSALGLAYISDSRGLEQSFILKPGEDEEMFTWKGHDALATHHP